MRSLKNESGQALLLVVMVLMVLMLLGAAAVTRTSKSRIRLFDQQKMVQASYIADAGIEKALANVRNNPSWLKGLVINNDNNFISSLAYAGGQIDYVKVKRTSTSGNMTAFCLESKGDYQGATRIIKVNGEMYDPIDFARGVWVRNNAIFSNNTVYDCSITGEGDMIFLQNTSASGDILATGNVWLQNNMTANSIVLGGNLSVAENVLVNSTATNVGGDIDIGSNAIIDGNANAMHNINMANNSAITGNVYYNGNLTTGSGATTGPTYPGGATPVVVSIPPFPLLDESIYSENPAQILSGTISGNFTADGIYYAPGDLILSGVTYTGTGLIVAHGKVTIAGELKRPDGDTLSSLAIASFGNVDGIGIEVYNNYKVYALLYSPNSIDLNHNIDFHGSIVCNGVIIDNNSVVTYEPTLQENHPPWMTTVVKIKSWKESYPVF